MTQTTTHNTNTPRRAHPAAVRAALRLHNIISVPSIHTGLRVIALTLLLAVTPPANAAVGLNSITGTGAGTGAGATTAPDPILYQADHIDMSLKVKNGEIVIRHGYFEGVWYANLNWLPLKLSYDNFDNSVKSITRSQTEYVKVAPGVYQDQNQNIVRQTDTGFRWNEPHGDWIEYNLAGEATRYGNRNGLTASFQYSGGTSTINPGVVASAGYITGVIADGN